MNQGHIELLTKDVGPWILSALGCALVVDRITTELRQPGWRL